MKEIAQYSMHICGVYDMGGVLFSLPLFLIFPPLPLSFFLLTGVVWSYPNTSVKRKGYGVNAEDNGCLRNSWLTLIL